MAKFQIEYYAPDRGTIPLMRGGGAIDIPLEIRAGGRGLIPSFTYGSPERTITETVEADTQAEAEAIILARNPNIVVTRLSTALPEPGDPGFIGPEEAPAPPAPQPGEEGFIGPMPADPEDNGDSPSDENIIPAQVDLTNLTQYLSQLGTTADTLLNEVINNREAFIQTDPVTGFRVFDPIAQLVLDRAAIAKQEELEELQRAFEEEQNKLQRDSDNIIASLQTNVGMDANQKQLEIANAQNKLERELSALEIASAERIAIARADAEKAQADRLYAQNQQQFEIEQDRINANLGLQLAELEKRRVLDEKLANIETQRQIDIANIQAQVGLGANVTQERVAEANRLAAERSADQARIADIEVGRRQAVAQETVAETQADAQIEIANANRAAQEAIAKAQADQTTTLAEKEIAIQEILQDRDEEIARLNREADKAIATTQAQTSPFFGLQSAAERAQAQLAGTGGAFGALGTLAASGTPFTADDISQAQRGGLTADQQLALARAPGNPFNLSANQQIALQTALARGGLTAEEQFNLQTALARGGLSAEDQFALQTALARGGLTPEQRLAEQRATIASDIFRASPQTLGALSGVLGGNQNLRTALNPFLGTTFTGNGTTTTPTTNMSVPTLRQYQSQTPFEQGATQANFAASGQNLEESILAGTPFGVNIPTGTLSAQNI